MLYLQNSYCILVFHIKFVANKPNTVFQIFKNSKSPIKMLKDDSGMF